MTAMIVGLTLVVALLAVLVAGLLRANAEVIRSLHQMGVNLGPDAPASPPLRHPGCPSYPGPTDAGDVIDLVGDHPRGDAISLAVSGVRHDTLIAFLTSGCQTCRGFWDSFQRGRRMSRRGPAGGGDPGARSRVAGHDRQPGRPRRRRRPGGDVHRGLGALRRPVRSVFRVRLGAGGRVVGEGVAAGWEEVRRLVANAVADGTTSPPSAAPAALPGVATGRPRSRADRARDQAVDQALEDAGIPAG